MLFSYAPLIPEQVPSTPCVLTCCEPASINHNRPHPVSLPPAALAGRKGAGEKSVPEALVAWVFLSVPGSSLLSPTSPHQMRVLLGPAAFPQPRALISFIPVAL